ncbi:hypothetical protein CEXT_420501 [Caerostris extrusa]|uniref:Uncharacterized protein n=1 Tax=Caerostris extrusa TaxID=172846 RepID=A0AAV4Q0Y0_CAEEX|nr:hypothetical protein CEXT_420501 [Caerostris extrusa]
MKNRSRQFDYDPRKYAGSEERGPRWRNKERGPRLPGTWALKFEGSWSDGTECVFRVQQIARRGKEGLYVGFEVSNVKLPNATYNDIVMFCVMTICRQIVVKECDA